MRILKILPYFTPSKYSGGIGLLAGGWARSLAKDYNCEVYMVSAATIEEARSLSAHETYIYNNLFLKRLSAVRIATR